MNHGQVVDFGSSSFIYLEQTILKLGISGMGFLQDGCPFCLKA